MMGFAAPFAFLWAALLGLLVLLYLWERQRRRVVLPSLLLWEQVRDDHIAVSRFQPDLLFLMQLLALLLLVTGLARPYWKEAGSLSGGTRHVIVLDITASMQARESSTTRFETARAEARQLVDGLPAADEVMLITAGRTVSVLSEWTRDHDAIRQALARTAAIDTGGDLALALGFAEGARQRSPLPADVFVFTDTPAGDLPAHLREHATIFQSGRTDANVAIESLQIEQGRFQGHEGARAQVQVRNFSASEVHGLLTVQVEDSVVERHGVTLGPQESKRIRIGRFPHAGKVTARLEPSDALALDNIAYGWIRATRPLRLLVVSAPSSLVSDLRRVAPAARLQLTTVTPEGLTPEHLQTADTVIFHRVAPDPTPGVRALYIYPPKVSWLATTGEATSLEIIDWNTEHAALRDLQPLLAAPLLRARIVVPPTGSEVLLRTRTEEQEIPLAFAIEREAQRLACITFDLEAEHVLRNDNTTLLLLLLNLIDWLAPQQDEVMIARTGEAVSLGAAPTIEVTDPRGAPMSSSGPTAIVEPLLAGVHEIRDGDKKRVLLANFADPQESSIGRTASAVPPLPVASPARAATRQAKSVEGFGAWLWLVAAALLVAEWMIATRRPAESN